MLRTASLGINLPCTASGTSFCSACVVSYFWNTVPPPPYYQKDTGPTSFLISSQHLQLAATCNKYWSAQLDNCSMALLILVHTAAILMMHVKYHVI